MAEERKYYNRPPQLCQIPLDTVRSGVPPKRLSQMFLPDGAFVVKALAVPVLPTARSARANPATRRLGSAYRFIVIDVGESIFAKCGKER